VVRHVRAPNGAMITVSQNQQQQLKEGYSPFSQDETLIARLHNEIVDSQRQFLGNYCNVQVAPRDMVAKPVFLASAESN